MKRSLPASLLALAAALALAGCTTYTGTPAAPPASETVPTEPGWEPTPFDCATLATEGDKPEQYPDKLLGDVEICRWWGVGKVAGHWHEKALVTWDDGRRELMRRIDQAEARAALLARCPTLGALLG